MHGRLIFYEPPTFLSGTVTATTRRRSFSRQFEIKFVSQLAMEIFLSSTPIDIEALDLILGNYTLDAELYQVFENNIDRMREVKEDVDEKEKKRVMERDKVQKILKEYLMC